MTNLRSTALLRLATALLGGAILAACQPSAASPGPFPTGTLPATAAPPTVIGQIAVRPGWDWLGELESPGEIAGGEALLQRDLPAGARFLLVSVACEGRGSVSVDAGDGPFEVACPAAPSDPARTIVFVGDATAVTARVSKTGQVVARALLESAPTPLALPAILLGDTEPRARMLEGCGVTIELAWGWTAGDSCATTLPGVPIEGVVAPEGGVRITVGDWTVLQASAACGRVAKGADGPDLFEADPFCEIDLVLEDPSTVLLTEIPPAEAPWLIELQLTAENREGDRFSGPFYAYVAP